MTKGQVVTAVTNTGQWSAWCWLDVCTESHIYYCWVFKVFPKAHKLSL